MCRVRASSLIKRKASVHNHNKSALIHGANHKQTHTQMTKAKQNDTLNGILYEMTNFIQKKWLNWILRADCVLYAGGMENLFVYKWPNSNFTN